MTENLLSPIVIANIEKTIPLLRRYARALSGSQRIGDALATEVLTRVVNKQLVLDVNGDIGLQLFADFHRSFDGEETTSEAKELDALERQLQQHLTGLDRAAREALLLSSIEGFSDSEIAVIRNCTPQEARADVQRAQAAIASMISGTVLIIEDESMIALEIQALVKDLGHSVSGVAPTYQAALDLGLAQKPDLILADIRLADDRTGLEAVQVLTEKLGAVPTIFITAYPEMFLSGKRPEPAFLIAKPFTEEQIRTAVGQAMFFSSIDALTT